jgi:uncharacterized membrane protein YdbT with pleckstrin-like domain
MKKFTLGPNETIKYKVRFAKRVLLFDFGLIIIATALSSRFDEESNFRFLSIMFLFAPVLIRSILNLLRITTHRIYITNEKVYFVKGYLFKRMNEVKLDDIIGVFYKVGFLDKRLKVANIKFEDKYHQFYKLRSITYAAYTAELLGEPVIKKQEERKNLYLNRNKGKSKTNQNNKRKQKKNKNVH